MPGPVSLDADFDPRVAQRGAERDDGAARAELQRVVDQVGDGALEQLDVELGIRPGCRGLGVQRAQLDAVLLRPARRSARAMSSSSSPTSTPTARSLNSGSSRRARSPSDCTRRAGVAGVAQRDLEQPPVVPAHRVAGPARIERLQARRGGGQRRAQVVRQVADPFATEVIEPAQRAPLPAQRRQHHLEGRSSAGRTRRASAPAAGSAWSSPCPSSSPRCESDATASVRRCSGRVTEAMTSAASRVVTPTMAAMKTSDGSAKLLRSASQREPPAGSRCATRYR